LAASVFESIEGFAVANADCVGISLCATNERAIRSCRRLGFVADPGGPARSATSETRT
jgi:hypothetical protein